MIEKIKKSRKHKYRIKNENIFFFTKITFLGLCAIIVLSPLPFGSARPMAWDFLGISVASLLLLNLPFGSQELQPFRKDLLTPAILFSVVLLFIIVQITPFTPTSWHNPLWQQTSETLQQDISGSIAANRQAGATGLMHLLSYGGVFFLSFVFSRNNIFARFIIKLITICGAGYAAYGLLVYWTGNTTILWFEKTAYPGDLTGTFVNRNSFATFLGLCFITALSQLFISFSRLSLYGDRRHRTYILLEFLSDRWWLFLALFLIATGLILTHSRGGFLSTLAGTLSLIVTLTMSRKEGRFKHLSLICLPLALVIIAFIISGEATLERLMGTPLSEEERLTVYQLTWLAIKDYPILGIGLGSFNDIFPMYRTTEVTGYFDLAHNDYLQNILELGLPTAICLFSSILCLIGLCFRGIFTRHRDVGYPCLGIAASVLVGLHAFVDFSLQIPAVTTYYMILLGLAVAQSRSTQPQKNATILNV